MSSAAGRIGNPSNLYGSEQEGDDGRANKQENLACERRPLFRPAFGIDGLLGGRRNRRRRHGGWRNLRRIGTRRAIGTRWHAHRFCRRRGHRPDYRLLLRQVVRRLAQPRRNRSLSGPRIRTRSLHWYAEHPAVAQLYGNALVVRVRFRQLRGDVSPRLVARDIQARTHQRRDPGYRGAEPARGISRGEGGGLDRWSQGGHSAAIRRRGFLGD